MRNYILGLFAVFGFFGLAKADVVAINGEGTGSATTFGAQNRYVVFSTSSSGLNLTSVNLWGNNSVTGDITFGLYSGSGTSGSLLGASSTYSQSTMFSSSTGTNLATLDLGSAIRNTTLNSGVTYTLAMVISGSGLSLQNVGTISGQNTFTYDSSATGANAPGFGFQINTVPEPGTMVLGVISALAGSCGLCWRRRHRRLKAETVVT